MSKTATVTVIIPTLAEAARKDSLLRAIDCILTQEGVKALPLVVINGNRFDAQLRADLEARDDIVTCYREEGSLPKAQAFGVSRVQTPFFAFLDDDDLYTPDALAHRLEEIEKHNADLVVTNIEYDTAGVRSPLAEDLTSYARDPLASVFELAWLCSINGLFRAESIGAEHFQDNFEWMEWTSLAIRLAETKRVAFSNKVTAIYFDMPDSASKKVEHLLAMSRLMASLDKSRFPRRTQRLIDRKYVGGLHAASKVFLARGEWGKAWKCHLACFAKPAGWRYLSYTRKLFSP